MTTKNTQTNRFETDATLIKLIEHAEGLTALLPDVLRMIAKGDQLTWQHTTRSLAVMQGAISTWMGSIVAREVVTDDDLTLIYGSRGLARLCRIMMELENAVGGAIADAKKHGDTSGLRSELRSLEYVADKFRRACGIEASPGSRVAKAERHYAGSLEVMTGDEAIEILDDVSDAVCEQIKGNHPAAVANAREWIPALRMIADDLEGAFHE